MEEKMTSGEIAKQAGVSWIAYSIIVIKVRAKNG